MSNKYSYSKAFYGSLSLILLLFSIKLLGWGAVLLFLACGLASVDFDKK